MKRREKLKNFFIYFLIFVVVFISIFPPLWMFLTSIKKPLDTMAIPPVIISIPPSLENWYELFNPQGRWEGEKILKLMMPNSIIASLSSTFLTIFTSFFAAYSLSRFKFRGRKIIAFAIITTRMLPPIATVFPLYLLMSQIGLRDTLFALILVYTTLNIPLSVWMLKAFIDEVPVAIEEAAIIDGAPRIYMLIKIILPLIAPGLVATSIFSFLLSWNDFAIAFFLTGLRAKTLPLESTAFMTEMGIFWGPMGAFGSLVMAPAIIFSFFASKYLIKGLTLGAVKA
ncbi:MAG: carbohydrate ABC transporter permease [Nitrososphaeria archaeon]